MFNHVTDSVGAAGAWAWVLALFVHARKVSGTFRIDGALWSAVWCTSDVVRQTRARRNVPNRTALRVGTARIGYARVFGDLGFQVFYKEDTDRWVQMGMRKETVGNGAYFLPADTVQKDRQ